MHLLKLYPAYGRGYLLSSSLRQDWFDGKDFSITRRGGPYTSIRDFKQPQSPDLHEFDGVQLLGHPGDGVQTVILRTEMEEVK